MSIRNFHKRNSTSKNINSHAVQSRNTSNHQSNNSSICERVLLRESKNTANQSSENEISLSHKYLDLNGYNEYNNNGSKIVKKIDQKRILFSDYPHNYNKISHHNTQSQSNPEKLIQQQVNYQKNEDYENTKLDMDNNLYSFSHNDICNQTDHNLNNQEFLIFPHENEKQYQVPFRKSQSNATKQADHSLITNQMLENKSYLNNNNNSYYISNNDINNTSNMKRIGHMIVFDNRNNESLFSNANEKTAKINSSTSETLYENKSKHSKVGYMLTNLERKSCESNVKSPHFENIKPKSITNNQNHSKNSHSTSSNSIHSLKNSHTSLPRYPPKLNTSNYPIVHHDYSDRNNIQAGLNIKIKFDEQPSNLKEKSQIEQKLSANVLLESEHSKFSEDSSYSRSTTFSSNSEYVKNKYIYSSITNTQSQSDINATITGNKNSNSNVKYCQKTFGAPRTLNHSNKSVSDLTYHYSNIDYNSRAEDRKIKEVGSHIKNNQLLEKLSATNFNKEPKKRNMDSITDLNHFVEQRIIIDESEIIPEQKLRSTVMSQTNTPLINGRNRHYPNHTHEKKLCEIRDTINNLATNSLIEEQPKILVRSSSANTTNQRKLFSSIKDLSFSLITTTTQFLKNIGQNKPQKIKCQCKVDFKDDEETCPTALKWLFSKYNLKDIGYLKSTYMKLTHHKDIDPKSKKQIALDINRTYPNSSLFSSEKG